MSDAAPTPGDAPQRRDVPPFDPNKAHHATPRLRRTISGSPVGVNTPEGQRQMLALGDRAQIAERNVITSPLAQFMLPHMTGEADVDAIAARAREEAEKRGLPAEAQPHLSEENVKLLVAQLDDAGLLEGPVFEEMLAKVRADYDESDTLPPGPTAAIADAIVAAELKEQATDEKKAELGPERLRHAINTWIDKSLENAEKPTFDALPKAVVAPHIDYQRGWFAYGQVYGRLRVADRPDRIVVLGPNSFGFGTGVVGCDKSFATPLGEVRRDDAFAALLESELGEADTAKLYAHRFDHEREHCVELHLPWVQCTMADDAGAAPPIYAALVHDPVRNNGESYDGEGLALQPFVDALRSAIENSPGTTLVICSANFSHLGRTFGDQINLADQNDEQAKAARDKALGHDQEMIKLLTEGQAEQLVASLAWQQNPTRWSSTGALAASMRGTGAESMHLLTYILAGDNQGMTMIGLAAATMD